MIIKGDANADNLTTFVKGVWVAFTCIFSNPEWLLFHSGVVAHYNVTCPFRSSKYCFFFFANWFRVNIWLLILRAMEKWNYKSNILVQLNIYLLSKNWRNFFNKWLLWVAIKEIAVIWIKHGVRIMHCIGHHTAPYWLSLTSKIKYFMYLLFFYDWFWYMYGQLSRT